DLLAVWSGAAEACRLTVERPRLPACTELAAARGLSYAVGWTAAVEPGAERLASSAHGTARVAVYFGRDQRAVQRLRRRDESGHARRCLEMAGVPDCCAEGLERGSFEEQLRQRYADEHPISWALNVALSGFDCSLLSWVPCRPDCPLATAAAYARFELLREAHPALAMQLAALLGSIVLMASRLGIVAYAAPGPAAGHCGEPLLACGPLASVARSGARIAREADGLVVDGVFLPAEWSRLYQHL
ncbi:MAG TPA: hypothetical protein VFS60_20350, partial [Thermoanaerobaculia bacterium]|nr:hypothetical protein [Thermoanaerobaculia bacterium]